jgi:hypothetical protein
MKRTLAICVVTTIIVHALIFVTTRAWLNSVASIDVAAVAWSHRYFYDYASQVLAGKIPYRDFAFEYPPLTLPLFVIPRLAVSDFEGYTIAFVTEMFVFDIAAIVLVARGGEPGDWASAARRLGWYTLYCFVLAPLVLGRFELAPMVLAFAGAHWWFAGRNLLGGVTAGLGALMKIFPGGVAAPALVWEVARLGYSRARGMAAFTLTVAFGMGCWLFLAGGRFVDSLGYHAERALEIESIFGGMLLLAGAITGRPTPWAFDHNAYHLPGRWSTLLASLTFPIQAITVSVVMWKFYRSGLTDGLRFSAAAILAFITFGKVLSPQYLIWLFPFLAVLEGRSGILARRIFLLCCLTTALIYPGPGFPLLLNHQAGAILFLNLRNVLLIWLFGMLLGLEPRCGEPRST